MKKIYDVEHTPTYWSCRVEIDEEFVIDEESNTTTKDSIKSMVDFWMGSEELLEECEGDYTKAFLIQLCKEAYIIAVGNNYNTYGIIKEFEDKEGYLPMDGSKGIEITYSDDFDLINSDFEVRVI